MQQKNSIIFKLRTWIVAALFAFFILLITWKGTLFQASFIDVPSTYPYKNAIEYVQSQDIAHGYPDGLFRPDQPINRAEFTKIIVRSRYPETLIDRCLTETSTPLSFPDVASSSWYEKYVCVAKDAGMIQGYPDGTFHPEATINFVEASKILVESQGIEVVEHDVWYLPYYQVEYQVNAVPQSIQSFDQQITRGEMAEMLYRFLTGVDETDYVTSVPPLSYSNANDTLEDDGFSQTPVGQSDKDAIPKTGGTLAKETISYGDDSEQKMDVFYNTALKKAPMIVLVHSNDWSSNSKESMHRFVNFFRDAGFVVATPSIRQSGPSTNLYPIPVNDTACAVATLKRDAVKYQGDPDTILLLGHGAGAHLAALVAYNPEHNWLGGCKTRQTLEFAGFIGSSGVYDFNLLPQGRWQARRFLGEYYGEPKWNEAEPINFVNTGDPPALLITPALDTYYNATSSKDFAKMLSAKAVKGTLKEFVDIERNDFLLGFEKFPKIKQAVTTFIQNF